MSTKPTQQASASAPMTEEALQAIEGREHTVSLEIACSDVLGLVAQVRRQREEIAALTARAERAEKLAAGLERDVGKLNAEGVAYGIRAREAEERAEKAERLAAAERAYRKALVDFAADEGDVDAMVATGEALRAAGGAP